MTNCGPLPDDNVYELGHVFVKTRPQTGVQVLCQEIQSCCIQILFSIQAGPNLKGRNDRLW